MIPVYNERAQLASTVTTLMEFTSKLTWAEFDIVIADNGSTDGTTEIAAQLSSECQRIKHQHSTLKGRGRALRAAWLQSDCDYLSYMDVDLSTDIQHLPELLHPLMSGEAQIAIGSRLLIPDWTSRGFKREILSRGYNHLLSFTFRRTFSDAQCGFKAITKSAAAFLLPKTHDDHWFFDTELLLLGEHYSFTIKEIPVRWMDDPDSRVRIVPTIMGQLAGIVKLKRTLTVLRK